MCNYINKKKERKLLSPWAGRTKAGGSAAEAGGRGRGSRSGRSHGRPPPSELELWGELKEPGPGGRGEKRPARVVSFPTPPCPAHLLAELSRRRARPVPPRAELASGPAAGKVENYLHLTSCCKRLRARGIKPLAYGYRRPELPTRSALGASCPLIICCTGFRRKVEVGSPS